MYTHHRPPLLALLLLPLVGSAQPLYASSNTEEKYYVVSIKAHAVYQKEDRTQRTKETSTLGPYYLLSNTASKLHAKAFVSLLTGEQEQDIKFETLQQGNLIKKTGYKFYTFYFHPQKASQPIKEINNSSLGGSTHIMDSTISGLLQGEFKPYEHPLPAWHWLPLTGYYPTIKKQEGTEALDITYPGYNTPSYLLYTFIAIGSLYGSYHLFHKPTPPPVAEAKHEEAPPTQEAQEEEQEA